MKRSIRKDKLEWANGIAQEAKDATKRGQMKSVYDATRRLCNEPPIRLTSCLQMKKEHFAEVLNRPSPEEVADDISDQWRR